MKILLVALVMLLASVPGLAQPSAEELEQRFADMLDGARLVGHFSVTGPEGESLPQDDRYTVSRIERMEDGRFLFVASMSYGDEDVAIPMPFDVEWAGDTPVITLTEQTIPGLGTFTARVLVYDGFYAGTWWHGPVGGHLWGRVETGEPAPEDEGAPDPPEETASP